MMKHPKKPKKAPLLQMVEDAEKALAEFDKVYRAFRDGHIGPKKALKALQRAGNINVWGEKQGSSSADLEALRLEMISFLEATKNCWTRPKRGKAT